MVQARDTCSDDIRARCGDADKRVFIMRLHCSVPSFSTPDELAMFQVDRCTGCVENETEGPRALTAESCIICGSYYCVRHTSASATAVKSESRLCGKSLTDDSERAHGDVGH